MAKTTEEINKLKQEYTDLTKKLSYLNDDELSYVTGGAHISADYFEIAVKARDVSERVQTELDSIEEEVLAGLKAEIVRPHEAQTAIFVEEADN
ncbi:MAG: hypothetical protein Q4E33_05285 [Erysipelotrichaceae bacterium]|nr:hypothetical protein [Erysipelotrichaceae bacterium]